MATISLCMIVKNEEENLERCLNSVVDLCDEIVIVDTGSTDRTKEIAAKYTSRIFDFEWNDDFSAARNFAFSKASMEYIYSADADEELLPEDREKFKILKENIVPEIEMVQMLYVEDGIRTVLNSKEELRPKLYKRERHFVWEDPIHETVRLQPVVFDSDIRIQHRPKDLHSRRDLSIFEKAYKRDGYLSENILQMYCKELFKWGEADELSNGADILMDMESKGAIPVDLANEAYTVIAKAKLLSGDEPGFFKYIMKPVSTGDPNSESCVLLAQYYEDKEDDAEASVWYINALFETLCIMDIGVKSEANRKKLIHCLNGAADLCDEKGMDKQQEYYLALADSLKDREFKY
ncbi:MAG: glycosyltransferase family 2 protein [Lachnospiraceae bacterium]|nr:glycosyltransferase family 2 protein [Lachnospiraceae bacterium]